MLLGGGVVRADGPRGGLVTPSSSPDGARFVKRAPHGLDQPDLALVVVLLASSLGETTTHDVADRDDRYVEPGLCGAERVLMSPRRAHNRSRDQNPNHN